ncbi:amino acid adenylation domain-containing protein [Variovorax boronicumulans]|uniref:polyketide synthase n=1 Tax=Variovorax boronicumulans TaxID=436515 RepID=UPI002474E83D|nr:polyketide synthase [Variovorax boronicumulans]MDH6165940.1 amino acid adenylation domain-containing protein [Variovorax boronicumulans]
MNTRFASPPPVAIAAQEHTLDDLFVPRHDAAEERLTAALTLEADLVQHWLALLETTGFLPDTLFEGAWRFLQSRWLGAETNGTAHAWLAQLDSQRRTTPPQSGSAIRLSLEAHPGYPARLQLDAPATLMDASSAGRLLAAIADTAADLLARPDTALCGIRTLPDADRHHQLAAWNTPPAAVDRALTVPAMFSRQAAATPDAVALVEGDETMRYGELERRTDRFAQHLWQSGVRPGDNVGMIFERSMDAIVATLGILKAGAAYVPVPADFPPGRVAGMLAQAGATRVVVAEALAHLVPAESAVLLPGNLEDVMEGNGYRSTANTQIDGESVAYVMYTSGSTGIPKGIEICHRAILRLVVGVDYVELAPGRAMLHAAPLAFDASTLEIWGPLLNGGRCVIHDERVPTGAGLARTIARHDVHTAWLTAALFNAVVDGDPQHLAGLRHLFTGGEALSVAHVRRALEALPGLVLSNGYGPTECTTFAATHRIDPASLAAGLRSVPLGRPIKDTVLRVLSPSLALLPSGLVGELCIGGHGLARGYLGQPELTAARFVPDPFGGPEDRLYRTGDLARWLPDGTIEFIGRIDGQVKIRGHRIETGEIEAAILAHPAIQSCTVVARPGGDGALRLVAYLVARAQPLPWEMLRTHLAARLPAAMLPSAQVWLAQLPVTSNGKLDRKALPEPAGERPELAQPFEEARDALEAQVCGAFARALCIGKVGRNDNFFDLGGNSLLVLQVLADLQRDDAPPLSTNLFFRHPTPAAIAAQLQPVEEETAQPTPVRATAHRTPADAPEAIALIATAGRFPGAADVEQFWDNLVAGRDTVSFFDDATLDASVSEALRGDPAYVRARGVIEGIENFDAAFFGIGPKEATLMDPQHRVFLEICWECLERAGYVPDEAPGPVGVYAGMYNATYFQRHVASRPDLVEAVGEFQVMLANEKDYITTRVANRLNLRGPAVSVNTACSTSLVAVAQAFHALRTGQCYMALAGGASVTCPPRSGYLYNEGSMLSPDGHTRSFDAQARGTVFSDGAAVVLLKRLSDALADGDTIYAVLRSACVNNDGGAKASFTAPSVDGQAAVIRAALAAADVDAQSIGYVEAHGTATPMGDPIEVEALAVAFAEHTDARGYCTLGSLKSNVGHMVTAAGAAGLIKAALSLHHELIPPTAHFTAPNPAIDFARTPFFVSNQLQPWPRADLPRRAGVSSFGVGGTNAHVVLEEAPTRPAAPSAVAGVHVLPLSARSEAALAVAAQQLAAHLEAHPGLALADAAFTLCVGRKAHAFRSAVLAADAAEAIAALRMNDAPWRTSGGIAARTPQPVLMFPGQGAQYAGMGRALHASDTVFAAAFDDCLHALDGVTDFDLRERMFSDDPGALTPTAVTQPALFTLEYALARRLLSLGLRPHALIGHSVGEFVAAVIAGVMRLEDAARLVARRGALMQALPAGTMLSVRLGANDLAARLAAWPSVSLAAENGPTACVAAGPTEAMAQLQAALEAEGIACRALQTSHAFHSAMMDGAVAPFEALVGQVALRAPAIPIFSTLTGRLLEDVEAASPAYWAQHLRGTVRFSPALQSAAAAAAHPVFVEVGPRNTLATLVRQHGAKTLAPTSKAGATAVSLLHGEPADEVRTLRLAAARLWTCGTDIDLARLAARAGARRVCLPTYPFERKRFWVDIAPIARLPAVLPTALPAPSVFVPPVSLEPIVTAAVPAIHPPLPSPPQPAASRAPSVDARLRTLFEDISGIDMAEAEGHAAFAELGLDSLTLTQAATQIKKSFKVNLSFRQLMENYRSLDALAAFLRQSLPPETEAQPAPAAPGVIPMPQVAAAAQAPVPMADPVPRQPAGALNQLIAQQMELMRQQLALLSGAAIPAAMATPEPVQALPEPQAQSLALPDMPREPQRYDVAKAFGAIARIHTKPTAEPSARQKARLATFVRRYVERTQKSKRFTEDNRAHMADPRVVNGFRPLTKEITYQLVIERSKGSKLWDIDGNEYVDALNGFGLNLFGWQPDFVQEAVRKQLDAGYEIGPQHPLAAEVTRLICELTGCERAGLCNTGSEAVMAALRIARTVTGRSTVVVFTGSYHGTFDEVLVRAGKGGKGLSAAPGVMSGMFGDVRVLDYGTPEALAFIRENAEDLAAVLVEPVQSRRPDFQPREFVQELREITAQSGTCLIFDEVITGFRTGLGGAQELFGVRADLATYGKVIGGGFPVGVIAGKRPFMDALDGGAWQYGDDSIPGVGVTYFAGTFVRHPLALAAAKASLEHLKEAGPALQAALGASTAAMAEELTAWCTETGAPIAIRHFASLWRVNWLEDHPLQDLLFAMMRSRGVHILDNFPCFLTTAHSQEDIAAIQRAFKESVAEMQESGFLPRRTPAVRAFDVRKPSEDGSVLGRDVDGQLFWYVPGGAEAIRIANGRAA